MASTVLVTGAARGIGLATARRFLQDGWQVALLDIDGPAQRDAARALGDADRVLPLTCDVAVVAEVDAAFAEVRDRFGTLHALVNNAGVNRDRTLMRMSGEEFDDVIAVNLRGTWACSKHAALAMKESGGCILNVTSNSGLTGSIGQTNYAAAKAGVVGMTFTWAQELSRYGIRCNAIWPLALTQMTEPVFARRKQQAEEAGDPVPAPADAGFGDPDDVAPLVAFLLSDAASEINGQVISFNGRKLALWSHPREIQIERRDAWTLDDLIRDFGATTGQSLEAMYRASAT